MRQRFRYCLDPLFLVGCTVYAINRWLIKPRISLEFFQYHFNDLWLIPCALPPVLWLHRVLKLRSGDTPPSLGEITGHLLLWSIVCEVIGPHYMPASSGDYRDVIAYTMGALLGGMWWHRHRWLTRPSRVPRHEF